jgi:hypothetical protein
MKHAGGRALDELEPLLRAVRRFAVLKEKKRGTFYLKSSGFLHFHEDPAGFFADLKIEGVYQRFRVGSADERRTLLHMIAALLQDH